MGLVHADSFAWISFCSLSSWLTLIKFLGLSLDFFPLGNFAWLSRLGWELLQYVLKYFVLPLFAAYRLLTAINSVGSGANPALFIVSFVPDAMLGTLQEVH